jgi:Spy/CpxP family protein refolding chaperone
MDAAWPYMPGGFFSVSYFAIILQPNYMEQRHIHRRAEEGKMRWKGALAFLLVLASAALVGVPCASAQEGPPPGMGMGNQGVMGPGAVRGWFRGLNLTEDDLDRLEKILGSRELELSKAQNEIRIYQTRVTNMLLDPDPDMKAIEDTISKSLVYEKTVRMIQIERQVAIRRIFGEDRWQAILFLVREARMSEKMGQFANSFSAKGLTPQEVNMYSRLLTILRQIM